MKLSTKFAIPVILVIALAFPGTALASGLSDDQVVFGGTYTLASGETLNGSLVVFGGSVELEVDSRVTGDVVLFGGSIEVDGEVAGNLVGLGASISLQENAVIQGDLVGPGSALSRADGSRVLGEVVTGSGSLFTLPYSSRVVVNQTPWGVRFISGLLWFLFRTFALSALAVLLVMFIPDHTQRVAAAMTGQPVAAGGLGLLTMVVMPPLVIVLTITLILIPVGILGVFLVGLAILFGWIALGVEVGNRLARMVDQDWPLPVVAGIGTFLLTFVVTSVGSINCVGWIAPFLVMIFGLGGVLLTRFGMQAYAPAPLAGMPPPQVPESLEQEESPE